MPFEISFRVLTEISSGFDLERFNPLRSIPMYLRSAIRPFKPRREKTNPLSPLQQFNDDHRKAFDAFSIDHPYFHQKRIPISMKAIITQKKEYFQQALSHGSDNHAFFL